MDDLKEKLERVNSWIGNCDQKASFLLTMVGVIATIICTSDYVKAVKEILISPFVDYWTNDIGGFNELRFSIALFLIPGFGCLFAAIIFEFDG